MKTFILLLSFLAFGFSATITVNSTANGLNATDNHCTLREAVLIANNNDTVVAGNNYDECNPSGTYGNDTIVFDSSLSGQTITLNSQLSINLNNQNLTIDGGNNNITISGGNSVRIFSTPSGTGGVLELKNLRLVNSRNNNNGSLITVGLNQTLRMSGCFVENNTILNNTASGTIHVNGGTVEIVNCTFSNNSVTSFGSVVYNPSSSGKVIMRDCFVGYNSADSDGTIYNAGGTVEIVNCTFSNNSAASGSVVFNQGGTIRMSFVTAYNNPNTSSTGTPLAGTGGTIRIKNSIIAQTSGNICGSGPTYIGSADVFVSNNTNNTNCPSSFTTVQSIADLKFGTLDFHGGNTRVYSIEPDSVAVNAVTDCTDASGNPVNRDQRGKDRNKNGKRCDAGAFEVLLTVNVSVSPQGAGSVSGGGEYEKGATATLVATPNTGYTFSNWSGDCSSCNTSTCNLNVNNNKTCTANFSTASDGGGGSGGSGGNGGGSGGGGNVDIPTPLPNTYTISTNVGALLLQTDAGITGVQTETPSFSIPPGYVAPYGAIRMTLNTFTGFATIRIIFPRPIPRGSRVYKVVGNNVYDITAQVSIQGSTITYIVGDNSSMDSDPTQGTIVDPVVLLENTSLAVGGAGGCSTGGWSGWTALLSLLALRILRRFRGLL